MILTDYIDINVNYVYLSMEINITHVKNYTHGCLPGVSHSVSLRVAIVALLVAPKTDHSFRTRPGLCTTHLVEVVPSRKWGRTGERLKARTEWTKLRVQLFQTGSHLPLYPHAYIIIFKDACTSTQRSSRHVRPGGPWGGSRTPWDSVFLQDSSQGSACILDSIKISIKISVSTLGKANNVSTGCVNQWKFFRRYFSDKPLKSADSAALFPVKYPVKTLRAIKRNIPYSKSTKATPSYLEKINMEKSKMEKRNRRLTRKAKRARVRFTVDDSSSSSTNSAEENQCRPVSNLGTELIANKILMAQINSTTKTAGCIKGNLIVKQLGLARPVPQGPMATFTQNYTVSKRYLHYLHLDQRTMSKSPMKRSHMVRDTTYTVNQNHGPPASSTQFTQEDMPSLSVTVNVSDDQNNNDVIIGMEPNENSQRRNDAIEAMERAGRTLSSAASPSTSTSGSVLSPPETTFAILPTPIREEIGIAGAHNLALAAIANALANEQLNRVQPFAAEPNFRANHVDNVTPNQLAEQFNNSQAALEDDGQNVTVLEDNVFEEDTVELEPDNDEVTPLNPLGPLSPTNPFRPFSPPHDATSDASSPPWTPNLHPCQAPVFVPYNACRHDYTRSDERVCYDDFSSDCSPTPPCNPRSTCSPGCFSPRRCLRHYPFTFGCNVCIESGWNPPHHPDLNLTPEFIRVGPNYPNDVRPVYEKSEAGRYFPINRMFSPFPASSQQVWVDATPSSTASSDVERHEETKRQTINTETSTSSMDLSTMFQDEVDILVDNWSLEQIRRGNTDEEFLNADRNKRKEMMSMGKYDPDEDPEEIRRLRHPSEADSDIEVIFIYSSCDENGPWVPMPRAGEIAASGAQVLPSGSKRSKRLKSRRRTAVPPFRISNSAPAHGAQDAATIAVHTPFAAKDPPHSSFKENVVNTPNEDNSVLTHKIVTPYQEAVETPPVIYSVVDNGKDYTDILKDLVSKGIKYTRMEAVWTGSSDLSMEKKLKDAEEDYDGVVKRQDYLENMHHLFLSGIAARDASVTDYTTADDTTVHAPPSPQAPFAVFPPVKSAEDAAMSVVALRKEANRLILEADRLTEANEAAAETTTLLIREAEKIIGAMESKLEEGPLTLISRGLKQAEALLQQKTPIREETADKTRLTMINTPVPGTSGLGRPMIETEAADPGGDDPGASGPGVGPTRGPKGKDDDQEDLSEYFTPMEEPSKPSKPSKPTNGAHLLEYRAPTPSRSFSNISRIEKIVDPLDPLVFSHLTLTCSLTYSLTDRNGESAERKLDADYVPSYSNLATSESDISVVTVMSEETRSKLRSRSLARQSMDTVQRYSEDIIRRPSQRRASVHAKASIRDQLISEKDKKDASYNGGETRKDTPQVSPSIPLNPDTPLGNGGWQRPFTPTNNLVLTRPVFHINGDNELDEMVKRFNSSAATSTASIIRAPLQELQQGFRPARRSFLRPASRPVSSSLSAYPPPHGLKTWRKYPGSPTKLVQIIGAASENLKASENLEAVEDGGGDGMPTNNEQTVIGLPSSLSSPPSSSPPPPPPSSSPPSPVAG